MPDRRAGEAIDLLDAEGRCRLGGLLDLLGGALTHPSGSPSPQTCAGTMPLCRSSMNLSATA